METFRERWERLRAREAQWTPLERLWMQHRRQSNLRGPFWYLPPSPPVKGRYPQQRDAWSGRECEADQWANDPWKRRSDAMHGVRMVDRLRRLGM